MSLRHRIEHAGGRLPRRKRGRTTSLGSAVVGVFVFLFMLLQFAMPAQAVFRGEPPGAAVPSDIVEITMTGTEPGASVTGGLPPVGGSFDPTTGYPDDVPAGYDPLNESFAGVITTVDAEGNGQQMYCIDIRTNTYTGLGYENGSWEESNVPNIGYVDRILNSYYPDQPGEPAAAPNDNIRAAAVQAAIWFFSDGYVLEDGDPIRPYTAAIVADVLAAGPLTEPPAPNVSIDPPTAAGPTDGVTGPFTITSDAATVTVEVPAGYTLYTDPAGTVPLVGTTVTSGTQLWVRNDNQTTDPVVLTATAVVPVETGNVYLYAGNNPSVTEAQKLILAADAQIESNAQATAEFFIAGDLTVSKAFAGDGVGLQGAISLVVDCGASGVFTFDIPEGTDTTVTETVTGLPVGTVCSVTEPVTGSTTAVTVTPVLPEPVTITDGENVLAVSNTVDLNPGSLQVTKTITGTGAGLQDDIVIHVQCGDGLLDEVFVLEAGTVAGSYTQLYEGIPAGTLCRISEPTSGANEDVTVESTLTGEVTILAGTTQLAEATNLYAPVPVTERLPKTGAESLNLALMGGGAMLAGSALVLASVRRRHG